MNDYDKIRAAIEYIADNRRRQPTLTDLASHLELSDSHLQKLFLRWAGLTPKRFLQVLTLEEAKNKLANGATILEAADAVGLSTGSRLYDHFVELDAISPGEFKRLCASVSFQWGQVSTPFGEAVCIFSLRGLSELTFIDEVDAVKVCEAFQKKWRKAKLDRNDTRAKQIGAAVFSRYAKPTAEKLASSTLRLCIAGTNFQVAVWRALLALPYGSTCSYSDVAQYVKKPSAVRAVASAIGANQIACLIPCHRVLRQTGELGGYRWGLSRKQAMLIKEQS